MDYGKRMSLTSVPKLSELAAHEIVEEPPKSSVPPTLSRV